MLIIFTFLIYPLVMTDDINFTQFLFSIVLGEFYILSISIDIFVFRVPTQNLRDFPLSNGHPLQSALPPCVPLQ